MGKTHKDLKSHKKGFGIYGFSKPKRKMTPFALTANKITGEKRTNLVFTENDISQDNFYADENNPRPSKHTHWHNAKEVKRLRKQLRTERKEEKSSARSRIKRQLKKEIRNLNK